MERINITSGTENGRERTQSIGISEFKLRRLEQQLKIEGKERKLKDATEVPFVLMDNRTTYYRLLL